jgi:ABC-type nitrate/sulfonate/bicarbonate transport system substrate-binding protein
MGADCAYGPGATAESLIPGVHRVMKKISAAFLAASFVMMLIGTAAAEPSKVGFGLTTTDISTGHAGQTSIPKNLGSFQDENLDVKLFGVAGSAQGIQLLAASKIHFISLAIDDLLDHMSA